MANIKVYSRSNVTGTPSLWRPLPNNFQKDITIGQLGAELVCDDQNDFQTTYMTNRIWNPAISAIISPPYVQCDYVE